MAAIMRDTNLDKYTFTTVYGVNKGRQMIDKTI